MVRQAVMVARLPRDVAVRPGLATDRSCPPDLAWGVGIKCQTLSTRRGAPLNVERPESRNTSVSLWGDDHTSASAPQRPSQTASGYRPITPSSEFCIRAGQPRAIETSLRKGAPTWVFPADTLAVLTYIKAVEPPIG